MKIIKKSLTLISLSLFSLSTLAETQSWESLLAYSSKFDDRLAGSASEHKAADWLINQYEALGLEVKQYPFTFFNNGKNRESRNIEVVLKGKSPKTLVIGAHYDSTGHRKGSAGLIDNASGVITLLALAKEIQGQAHYYTIRLVSFGAEEVGLQGAKKYVTSANYDRENLVGMINLDTVVGGDYLYIHSAHSSPYICNDAKSTHYTYSTWLRDALLSQSQTLSDMSPYQLHPATKGYPAGETGGWSDHAPFACEGLPIAHIEATNFMIKGKSGFDGYSQTRNPNFWTCFNAEKQTACQTRKEKGWGQIWHTKYDQEKYLFPELENNIKTQFYSNIELLKRFVLKFEG